MGGIRREGSIKDFYQRRPLQSLHSDFGEMRVAITLTLLLASSTFAAPQFEGIKNLFSSLAAGDQDEESGTEKVPYTTLKQFDGYEMRQYPSVKWACTELTYEREDAAEEVEVETDEAVATLKALQEYQSKKKDRKNRPQTKMFMKLFRYISGVNKEQDEVAMTAPVLTSMKLLEGNQITKEMCFYIEKKHQANPPTPVDPDAKIETNKEFTVYVHTFGGYAMKDAVNIREARKFAEVLDNAGEEVDKSVFYTAGYDSPMKFWNRRNEIMYLVPGGR